MNMITTSDVMVGDWVHITIEGEQYPAVVNSIKLNTEEIGVAYLAAAGDWEDGEGYDDIEPIPLTHEIMEANGIKYQLGMPWFQYGFDGEFELHYNNGDSINHRTSDITLTIRYVHELQHALRMCGIDREIIYYGRRLSI